MYPIELTEQEMVLLVNLLGACGKTAERDRDYDRVELVSTTMTKIRRSVQGVNPARSQETD